MVKIHELKDKQLVAQIHKYNKILKGLLKERKKRIASGKRPESLMTPNEKAIAIKMKDNGIVDNLSLDEEQSAKPQTSEASAQAEDTGQDVAQEATNSDAPNDGFELSDAEILRSQESGAPKDGEEDDEDDEEVEEVRVTQLLQLSQDQIQEFKKKSKSIKSEEDKKKKKKKGLFGL